MVLFSVGFFTLFERRVLRYSQFRKGPNKVFFLGLFQPFRDGLKLFLKENFYSFNLNYLIYFFCPFFGLIYSLFIWVIFPFFFNLIEFNFGFLFFLSLLSLRVYFIILCGWSSNSLYSILGCLRGVSQSISYEISLSLIVLCFFLLVDCYDFFSFYVFQNIRWFVFFCFPLFFCWFSCCLAERNRSPYDFSEGERELVSGFNVEYGGGLFSFLFISEYSSIIFLCFITSLLFFGGNYNYFFFYLIVIFICFCYIWVRTTFPRYRYDKLIYLAWKCYLPLSLNYIFFFVLIRVLIFYHFFLLSY